MLLLKKYFKWILLLSFVLIIAAGCAKDEDSPTENTTATFVGTWKLTTITATINGQQISLTPEMAGTQMTIVSKTDNTFSMTTVTSSGTTTNTGNWSISGQNLTLKYSDGTSATFAYTLSGKTFSIKDYAYTDPTLGNLKVSLDFTKQ